jgi:hypothetical protein
MCYGQLLSCSPGPEPIVRGAFKKDVGMRGPFRHVKPHEESELHGEEHMGGGIEMQEEVGQRGWLGCPGLLQVCVSCR